VGCEIGVSLLISGVFGDEMEVLSSDDDGSVHFGGDNGAGQDAASNRDHTSEGTFLVCGYQMLVGLSLVPYILPLRSEIESWRRLTDVGAFDGSLRRSEAQTNILIPSPAALADSLALRGLRLVVEEDVRLFLIRALRLHCQLGRHDCDYLTEVSERLLLRCCR
jgi:hypothetical protein